MDREDRRRFFLVGSVVYEVVTPLFRQRLENDYKSRGFGSLQAFLNTQPIIHILFHLRHRNNWCCADNANCKNGQSLPMIHCQWNLLYTENTGPGRHHCYCRYTANNVTVDDLDITLAALLLLNCCNLGQDEKAIRMLRQYKNDYISHNRDGTIMEAEYNTLWSDIKAFVLHLDPSKKDYMVRIENRPLDEPLCNKYYTCLVEFQHKLEKIDTNIEAVNSNLQGVDTRLQGINSSLQEVDSRVQGIDTSIQGVDSQLRGMDISVQSVDGRLNGMDMTIQTNNRRLQVMDSSIQGMNSSLQELLFYARRGFNCQCYNDKEPGIMKKLTPYRLRQNIFTLHHQYKLTSVLNVDRIGEIEGGVMMDDGRLVLCLWSKKRLLICNTDGSEVEGIPLQSRPMDVTAVNNSTVAVTLLLSNCIEMYNINNKHKLKSIPVPGRCYGITTINNKLVVGCDGGRLLMIDDQTGEVIHTVNTDCGLPVRFHTYGDRIFYCDNIFNNYNLYCYSYTDDKVTTLTLPSWPWSITSLQDGSLYVVCWDGSVQHVSSDVQHYKPVNTKGLKSLKVCGMISYNGTQRKLFTCDNDGNVKIFKQKKT